MFGHYQTFEIPLIHILHRLHQLFHSQGGFFQCLQFLIGQVYFYYLFYSGNGAWTANYAVGYAVSESPSGGFVKHAGNPILDLRCGLPGPGHCAVVRNFRGSGHSMFFHVKIAQGEGWERRLCRTPLRFCGPPGEETAQAACMPARK